MATPFKILYVCTGNIVRSPLGEALFREFTREAGVEEDYFVDSAGTTGYHTGEQADERMRETAAKRGYAYSHRARKFNQHDLNEFDLIIAMDQNNHRDLTRAAQNEEQKRKIRMMREFDPLADDDLIVPDPWYGGMDGFEHSFEIIYRSNQELLKILERQKED
jgi:protein-tyrosine phosphatase